MSELLREISPENGENPIGFSGKAIIIGKEERQMIFVYPENVSILDAHNLLKYLLAENFEVKPEERVAEALRSYPNLSNLSDQDKCKQILHTYVAINDAPTYLPSRDKLLTLIEQAAETPDHNERLETLNTSMENRLSKQERKVQLLIRAGCSNQEIGNFLFISPGTVKNHVHHILRKLNVSSRKQV